MDKILILGAGIYQVPLIKKAREMGLYTIVASIRGNYPGFQYADEVYYVDTTDTEKILDIATKEQISGICTTGTDVCVPTIGKVCDQLGLKGVSYEAAVCAANKSLMKEKFEQGGVRTARFSIAHDAEEILAVANQMRYPIMIKAVDSSGSRGITKIDSMDEKSICEAYQRAKAVSKLDYVVVEEYIDGAEFGAQALVNNGKLVLIMPHGDYVFKGDTGVPIGHYVPYEISNEVIRDAQEQVKLSIQALGIDNCAVNVDFILHDDEVYMLEIGARAGATCLTEMVSIFFGVDYYEMILQTALGVDIAPIADVCGCPNVCKLLISEATGVIESINLPAVDGENVVDLSVDYAVGESVNTFRIGPDRIGQIIVKGNTLEKAVEVMEETLKQVDITVGEA